MHAQVEIWQHIITPLVLKENEFITKVRLVLIIVELEPEPECRVDQDCPEDMTCNRERCINPCQISNPCTANQICSVQYHTVACLCPAGMVLKSSGRCDTITALTECSTDQDCPFDKLCHQGSCANPCSFTQCGHLATCSAVNHQAKCTCLPGLRGDPYRRCEKESK